MKRDLQLKQPFFIRKWGRKFIFEIDLYFPDRKADDPNDELCMIQHGYVRMGQKGFVEYNESVRDKAVGLDDLDLIRLDVSNRTYLLVLSSVHVIPDKDNTHKDLMRFIPVEKFN